MMDATALRWVTILGRAGLLPFVGLAVLLWLVHTDFQPWVALALAAYGALIASFLGGIHWGIGWSMPATQRSPVVHFGWGVVPSLLAWPGLLMPPLPGLAWMGALLLLCYAVDRPLYQRAGLSHWLGLRLQLTTVAALSCFLGASAL
ncbi:MAG: DUF3429 domain-containing protein [Hydrogenophaga sp.]|jgi:hypothetical protein|nr:DUF3429 domain-containing protein [Hydrogenophaga sp.]